MQVAAAAALLSCGTRLRAAFVGGSPAGRPVSAAPGLRPSGARPAPTQRRVFEGMDTAWMSDPLVSCFGWAALLSGTAILRVATMSDDGDTPKTYLKSKAGKALGEPAVQPVVCLGDSLTRGNLSADWVGMLREGLGDGPVLNAGVNMECSKNIQKRLNEIIACNPSHVTVLVGTNDLKAELSPVEGMMYRVFGKLPSTPSLEQYESTLVEIRDFLVEAGAKVALVSPPVLGEEPGSKANQRAALFAEAVQRVAGGGGASVTYVPLFERTLEALPKEGGLPYCGFNFFRWCCLLCVDLYLRGRDLEEVMRERNLGVTVDLVHLGPRAAKDLANMVADFVTMTRIPEVSFAPMGASSRLAMAAAGDRPARPAQTPGAISGPTMSSV